MDTAAEPTLGRSSQTSPGLSTWALLTLGVVAASVSAILIRYAEGADALAISFWRCAAGAAALVPFASWRGRGVDARHLWLSLLSGGFLALHFATWITSVRLTTIAASVLLVSTSPVFVALASRWLFSERLKGYAWAGIWLSLAGATLVGGLEFEGASFEGNLLALAGGIAAGGYLMAGAAARARLGIIEYAVVAYACAGAILLVLTLRSGVALGGYPTTTWLAIAALVVGPQLLGHTIINLVLKDIGATTVSVAVMAEPIIATAMAALLFDEIPGVLLYPGGIAILIGIGLVTRARRSAIVVE